MAQREIQTNDCDNATIEKSPYLHPSLASQKRGSAIMLQLVTTVANPQLIKHIK